MTEQLKCKLCKSIRTLTEEEILTTIDIISKRNLKEDSILNIWSIFDGETCPDGGTHEYDWNKEFLQKMLDDSSKIKDGETEVIRNNNENVELENKIEQIKKENDNRIKDITEKIQKNKERNILLQDNKETIENILKTSGREWRKWL